MSWPKTTKNEITGEVKTQQTDVREVDLEFLLREMRDLLEDIRFHLRLITDENREE